MRLTLNSLLIGICMHDYMRFVCFDEGKAQIERKKWLSWRKEYTDFDDFVCVTCGSIMICSHVSFFN